MESKKRKNLFTIMIIPHSERTTLTFQIPLLLGQIIGFAVVFAFVCLMIFAFSYQNMRTEIAEYSIKAEEYKLLREQMDSMAKETEMMREKMKSLEKLDTDIRDIMKNDLAMAKIKGNETDSGEDYEEKELAATSLGSIKPDILLATASRSGGFLITRNQTTIREQMNNDLENIKNEIDTREESLTVLKSAVEERQQRLENTPSIWPVNNARITSTFGYRRSPFSNRREFHKGIDLATKYGSPVYATHDGVVTFSGWKSGYGYTIIISNDHGFSTLYAHNSTRLANKGDRINKGDIIARVGNTGRSTGAHLHYEVWVNGSVVNPKEFM